MMVAEGATAFVSQGDEDVAGGTYWRESVEGELRAIQEDVLAVAILALPILGLVWLAMALPNEIVPLSAASRPALVLFVSALGAHYLRLQSTRAASWLVVGSMVAAVTAMVAPGTSSMTITAGILVVVAANALLAPGASLAVTIAIAVAVTLARHIVFGGLPWWIGLDVLVLYLFFWAAVFAGSLQVRRAFEISAMGWATSRRLLMALRERRGELHRLVTAQRESAYRLERMNRELVRARREADQARHAKEQLVATISHELRGPLNLILGFSRVLALSPEAYGEPLPAPYRRDIDVIYRNSQHLSTLIEDVLDLSRAEADSLPLVKDEVHLAADVVDRVVEAVGPLIRRKGLALELDVAADLPLILADAVRLRQVLTNLVSNAARLTDKGSIAIGAANAGTRLLVTVSDTGPGIPPEQLNRLFVPFSTLRPDDPSASGGAGLGLSISKRLVELHGGDMWVESVEGLGSTFSFSLPLPHSNQRPIGLTKVEDVGVSDQYRDTCLVIGDDPQLLRTLARHMGDTEVVGIPGAQALPAVIEKLRPACIVGSPRQIARIRRQMPEQSETMPLIALPISFGPPEAVRSGGKAWVLAYLVKPISQEMLASAIRPLNLAPDMRALVVDDDPDAARLLSRLLAEVVPQCRIATAYSGDDAMRRIEQNPPDLLLLDLMMPQMTGDQLIAWLSASPALAHVPVVVVSARDEPDARRLVSGPVIVNLSGPAPLVRVATWIAETIKALAGQGYDPPTQPPASA